MPSNSGAKRLLRLALFVVFAIVEIPHVDCGPPPWLNICMPNGKHYYMHDVPGCPSGFLFKTPISGFCVCGHGVWQFKTDYCGKDIIIAAKDADCYFINTPVRWVRQIGNKYDAYAEYYFVTDPTWDEVRPIHKGSTSPGGYSVVGAVSPSHVLLSCNEDHCFEVAKLSDDIYRPSDMLPPFLFSNISVTDGYFWRRDCPMDILVDPIPYDSGVVQHGMINRMSSKIMNHNRSSRSHECLRSCVVIPPIPNYNDTYDETDPELPPNCTETENNFKDLPKIMKNEIHEQSVRLMKNHYDVILKGKKTPTVNITEYEYFQTARVIFSKVCPESEVPNELLTSLLRMFRVVVNETQSKYPYRQMGDQSEDARIKAGLAECLIKSTQKIDFVYNETVCPRQFLWTRINWPGSTQNFSHELPCDLHYNTTKYDYVSEVAWKMVMFVHYYCAVDFENAGFDHSRLEYKLRNLFNREIRHRWYKQGESAALIEHMFQNFDLTRFKEGVDKCVAVARDASPYRKWIWRPKYIQFCGTSSGGTSRAEDRFNPENYPTRELWKGDAYCLHSFNQAIVNGWTRSGGKCLVTPTDPDCKTWAQREKPPCLILPPPTFENPKGKELTKPRLIKCYEVVGDWMFEPGAEELCHLYKYGDYIQIGKNYTQFDGKHCWSEYYEVAYLCDECREAIENTFTNIHDEPENGTKVIQLQVPKGICDPNSPGQKITNKELKQCWRILGDRIFEPGNELICYYINFGLGMTPLLPPPYHIPKPTFNDPRGQRLTDPEQKRCYSRMGDWIFTPGNEYLCCKTNQGDNTIITDWTQFDVENQRKCYSFAYGFVYKCEHEKELLDAGFPRLKESRQCEGTDVIPEKSPNSKGYHLRDPELIHCWNILGDIIFYHNNRYICFYICFGRGLTPRTTTTERSVGPIGPDKDDWCCGSCGSRYYISHGGTFRINVEGTNLVADLAHNVGIGGISNTRMISNTWIGRLNQRWKILSSGDSNAFLLQARQIFGNSVSENDGGYVKNQPQNDGDRQRWYIGRQSGSHVEIRNRYNNYCLTSNGRGSDMTVDSCGRCSSGQLFQFIGA